MARERELVCDDLAVGACGDALVYARALARLERMRLDGGPFALAASGGDLYERVIRLVEPVERSSGRSRGLAALAGATLIALSATAYLASTPGKGPTEPYGVATAIATSGPGLDPAIQRVAESALAGRNGCAVVLDLEGSRTVAIVNPEQATQRAWPAASTFKLVTAMAAVSEGLVEPAERVTVRDVRGPVDLRDALARSSNEYFSRLGARVGSDRLLDYARRAGFADPVPSGEVATPLPLASADPRRLGGVGQDVRVSPMQLARVIASIATGNQRLSSTALDAVREGMRECALRGTASRAFGPGSSVAGKTASAIEGDSNLGIFAGYAPYGSPRWLVVVALDEKGVYGSDAAVVAALILNRLE
jgi:beta-lactamase class D